MGERYIGAEQANLEGFNSFPSDHPIHMVNFLKFRDKADYPIGHEHSGKEWSGRRAYEEYLIQLVPIFDQIGARVVWRGDFQVTTLGPTDEFWDDMLIAEYPSGDEFMGMLASSEYQQVTINRTAALLDARLYRTKPAGS